MKILTVNLPQTYIDALDKLVETGVYPSRSELLRVIIREFLIVELTNVKKIKKTFPKVIEVPNEEILKKEEPEPIPQDITTMYNIQFLPNFNLGNLPISPNSQDVEQINPKTVKFARELEADTNIMLSTTSKLQKEQNQLLKDEQNRKENLQLQKQLSDKKKLFDNSNLTSVSIPIKKEEKTTMKEFKIIPRELKEARDKAKISSNG